MAQHSKPFFWRNSLAACSQHEGEAADARQLDLRLRRQTDASPPSCFLSRTRWLLMAGGLAVASALMPAALADTVYIVEVLSDSEDVLEVVRTEASDAYIVIKEDGTQSIIAGTFVDEANARKQASALHALNVSPTSISPFEYTPEDETVASAEDDAAVTEFVASSEPSADSDSSVSAPATEPQAVAPSPPADTTQVAAAQPEPAIQEAAAPVPGGGNSSESTDGVERSDRQYSALAIVPQGTSPEAALADVQHFFPSASLQPFNGSQAIQTGTFSHRSQAQLQADWLQEKGLHAIAVPADTLSPTSTVAAAPPAETAPVPETAAPPVEPEAPAVPVAEPPAESAPPTGSLSSAVPPESTQPPIAAAPPAEPQAAPATDATAAPVAAAPVDAAAYWVLVADPVGEKLPDIKAIVPAAEATLYNDQQVVRTGMFATEAEAMDQVRYLSTQGYEAGIFTTADNAGSAAATQPVQ